MSTSEWSRPETLPTNPAPDFWVEVQSVVTHRFHPYKENSREFKRGLKGRWQRATEYGGWENCERPVGPWRAANDNKGEIE